MSIEERLAARSARVVVVGLGYVGLPLAVAAADEGFSVVGYDNAEGLANRLRTGESTIPDIRSCELARLLSCGRLDFSHDARVLDTADVVVVCVPTPLLHAEPNMSYVEAAMQTVSEHLHTDMLVTLESTVYPGATVDLVIPLLERTGLRAGEDFFVAFSPERVDPGVEGHDARSIPKVIGGFSSRCGEVADLFYGTLTTTHVVSGPTVAEMAKLLENVYRCVNIALVFEMAVAASRLGISIWEVIDAAATKTFGFERFEPGPGIGGHCIPVDPFYLSYQGRMKGFSTEFIGCAEAAISRMPEWVSERAIDLLHREGVPIAQARVLILGVAYKRDVPDCRETPATAVINGLALNGADVGFFDPLVFEFSVGGKLIERRDLTAEEFKRTDLLVILADHSGVDYGSIYSSECLVFDTRNVMSRNGLIGPRIVPL